MSCEVNLSWHFFIFLIANKEFEVFFKCNRFQFKYLGLKVTENVKH